MNLDCPLCRRNPDQCPPFPAITLIIRVVALLLFAIDTLRGVAQTNVTRIRIVRCPLRDEAM